jgi:hypothetical protein
MDAHGRLRRSTSPARRVLKLLRDKEVTATVAGIVSSCLTIWPGSTCWVSTLSIRRGPHQPQPVFSDLWDPEIELLGGIGSLRCEVRCRATCSFLVISARVRRVSSDRPRAVHGVLLRRLDLMVTHPVHHRPQISLTAPATSSITGLEAGRASAARRPA